MLIQKVPAQVRGYVRRTIAVRGGRELVVNPGPATPETLCSVQSSYKHEKIRVFPQSRVTRHPHRIVASLNEILKTER